jgi:hypothetical protein
MKLASLDYVFWGLFFLGLWLVAVTGVRALPLLVLALAPGQRRCWFIDAESSQRLIRLKASAPVKAALEQVQGAGFELLGIQAEKIWWRRAVHEIALTSAEMGIFASIVLNQNRKAAGVYFYTPFDGGLVLTRSRSSLPEMERENISVKNLDTDRVERLLSAHRQRVRASRQKGLTPLAVDSQEARLAATRAYYASEYGQRAARAALWTRPVRDFALSLALLAGAAIVHFSQVAGR